MTAEQKKKKKKSLKSWIDGDMLTSPFLSRQIGLIALVAALVIVYVSNRYAFQHEQVEIQELRSKLNDVKYEALARSSELMEKSRESNIQKYIVEQGSELTFGSTELPQLLLSYGQPIDSIELCGLCTDICVISNAMILKAAFPEAAIAVDAACCAGVTAESHQTALNAMRSVQIEIRE